MSELGDAAMRLPLPLLVAPSIEYVLLPTPPTAAPAACVVPSAKPCDTRLWLVDGFTPAAKRVSMIGMFENMGRPSTMRLSKFWPDETDDVSRSGVPADTFTVSAICPTSIFRARLS